MGFSGHLGWAQEHPHKEAELPGDWRWPSGLSSVAQGTDVLSQVVNFQSPGVRAAGRALEGVVCCLTFCFSRCFLLRGISSVSALFPDTLNFYLFKGRIHGAPPGLWALPLVLKMEVPLARLLQKFVFWKAAQYQVRFSGAWCSFQWFLF